MPTCANCHTEQFDCVDGLYYCQLCQTQSQDLRMEEGDDEAPYNNRLVIRSNRGKGKKEKDELDYGRPWTTHEAFTIILKQQIKALIALGASPKLEGVVFKLWTLYLSKIGVAFDTSQCKTYVRPKGRDLQPGTLANPEVPPIRLRHTCQKRGLTRHTQQGDASPSDTSSTDDDESSDGDRPFKAPRRQCAPADTTDLNDDVDGDSKLYMVQSRHTGYMSMQKTICFCYLGLCHTNSLVLPSDLLRWIQSGRIPYGKNAVVLLPDDMKFSTNDAKTFCSQDLPSPNKMRVLTGYLAYFLGMKTFPKVSLEIIASRFILELNLPGELHGLVRNLMGRHPIELQQPINCRQIVCAPYGVLAMSYLIVLLKLLFGLDDHMEKELSNYAREFSTLLTPAQPLFVWRDWAHHMTKTSAHLGRQRLPCNSRDVKDIRSVDQCLQVYRELFDHKGRRKIVKAKRSNLRPAKESEALQQPFMQLLDRMKRHRDDETQNLACANDPLEAMYDDDIAARSECTNPSSADNREDFSVTTLRYITEHVDFCDQFDSVGLSDSTIQSSCVDTDSGSSDCDFQDSTMDQPKRKRKMHARCYAGGTHQSKRIVKEVLQHNVASQNAVKPTVSANKQSQIEELQKKLTDLRAHPNYVFYDEMHKNVDYERVYKHKSYAWLLALCCQLIDCDVAFLHKHVRQLEMLFIVDNDKLCTRAKWQKSVFERRYVHK